jgi:hypothetical protein
MNMENHGGIVSTGKTPDLSIRALWQSYQQSHLVAKQEELTKEIMYFVLQTIKLKIQPLVLSFLDNGSHTVLSMH